MKILISFYRPHNRHLRGQEIIEVGDDSLADEKKFKQRIVNEVKMGIGWQNYYWVVTDIINLRLKTTRLFRSKIFKPEDFKGMGKYGQEPWVWQKNIKKSDFGKYHTTELYEYKMGEGRSDTKTGLELKNSGVLGLYRKPL